MRVSDKLRETAESLLGLGQREYWLDDQQQRLGPQRDIRTDQHRFCSSSGGAAAEGKGRDDRSSRWGIALQKSADVNAGRDPPGLLRPNPTSPEGSSLPPHSAGTRLLHLPILWREA